MSLDELAAGATDHAFGHVVPFVWEHDGKRALQFSISAIQSRLDLRRPDHLDLEYTRLMMAFLLWQPRPSCIAMIGLGGGSLARFCHRHLSDAHVRVVENNPHVIALRERFDVPPNGERFDVVESDGAQFVRFAPKRFDVLLVDGYDADGLPRSLSTQRFFDDCAHALLPGGVFVMNLYTHPVRETQVLGRIRRSFGGAVLPVLDSENLNCVVFACHGHALSTLRDDALRRPRHVDTRAWASLRDAIARVHAAWKDEFA